MKYTLIKSSMKDTATRAGYNRLATRTFGLSFEDWYNSGHFDGDHIPYTVFDGEKAVANISVNLMDVEYNGETKRYIQLGTVMTAPAYRGKGLQREIFRQLMEDFEGKYDTMFLFANKTVTEFYPKLGFEKAVEYSFEKAVVPQKTPVKKLDMTDKKDVAMLKEYYEKGNSFSAFKVKNGFALEMFYLGGPYSENVFYIEKYDAVVVAEAEDNTVTCLDIFSGDGYSIEEVMAAFGCERLVMGFTPKDSTGFDIQQINDEDTVLFVHRDGKNIFAGKKLLFPMIAHT